MELYGGKRLTDYENNDSFVFNSQDSAEDFTRALNIYFGNESFPKDEVPTSEQYSSEQVVQPKKVKRSDKAEALHAKLKTDTHPTLKTWLEAKIKEAATSGGKSARAYLKKLAGMDLNDVALDNAEENLSLRRNFYDEKFRSLKSPEGIEIYKIGQKKEESTLNFRYPSGKYFELRQKIAQMSDKGLQSEASERLEQDFDGRPLSFQQEAVAAIEDLINQATQKNNVSEPQVQSQTTEPVQETRSKSIGKTPSDFGRLDVVDTPRGKKLLKIAEKAQSKNRCS